MTKILTDEDGNKYWMIKKRGEAYEKPYYVLVDAEEPIPHPPAKETYYLKFVGSDWNEPFYTTQLDLTPDAADKVAKAIEALLLFVQTGTPWKDGSRYASYTALADKARELLQDGSAA